MIPSHHLLSYSHGATLLFYLFFHHPTLVYISSLSDRKVPILLSLDFLPGMVYDLYYLVVYSYLWISCQFLLISVTSDKQLCSDKSPFSRTDSCPYKCFGKVRFLLKTFLPHILLKSSFGDYKTLVPELSTIPINPALNIRCDVNW